MGIRASNSTAPSARNTNLDVLRAVAVFMVLGRHYGVSTTWIQVGWAGVDLFFVLSGFLISGLLFAEWKKYGAISLPRFYIRRGLKIYPAFYLLIAVTVSYLLLRGKPVPIKGALVEAVFLQSYFEGLWNHTWSLGVEEHFYLFLPLLLWIMTRLVRTSDPFRHLPKVFVALAAVVLLFRIAAGWHETTAYPLFMYPTHLRIDGLFFGVVLSYYYHFRPRIFRWFAATPVGVFCSMAAAILLFALPAEDPFLHTVGLTIIWLGFGFLLARMIGQSEWKRGRIAQRLLARIGYYSYSIYLWHMWVARGMHHLAGTPTVWSFTMYLGLCVIVGIAAARIIEMPVLALRDRWFPSRSLDSLSAQGASSRPPETRKRKIRQAGDAPDRLPEGKVRLAGSEDA
jgi:peptidoglycan/LPS O-acetylase OafA/YrhL